MLYLFNSAFRPKYTANVLNTLALPSGWINEYRYDPQVHIARATFDELDELKPGTFTLIVFVDRFAVGGYEYHPIRTGTFVKMHEAVGRRFFAIQLDDFVYPRDAMQFGGDLSMTLPSLPKLTNNTPDTRDDGHYVHVERSLLGNKDDFLWQDKAWSKAVDALGRAKAFSDSDTAFFRLRLIKEGRRPAASKVENVELNSRFRVSRDRRYELAIDYRYPSQWTDPTKMLAVKIGTGDNVKLLGASSFNLTATADTHRVSLISKKFLEDSSSHISFTFEPQQSTLPAAGMDRSLPIILAEPTSFWLQIIAAFLSLGLINALLTIDFAALAPLTLTGVVAKLTWPKVVAGGVQALVLLWIFRLIGKKFL